MASSKFEYIIYIRTTPVTLWQGLIDPEFTRQYWAETHQESEWKEGAAWRIMIPDGRVGDQGKILEIDPPQKLVVSWQNEFVPELKAEGFSRLTYLLEPAGDSVKLSLTHEMDRADSLLIAAVSTGWPHILSSLKSLLETGESLAETRKWPEGV